MSGGGSNTTTTVQQSDPWAESVPYLKNVMTGAQSAYNSGQGFKPYPDSTVTPFDQATVGALQGTENLAGQGTPLAGAAQNQAMGVLNSGGMTPWQQSALQGTHDIATGARSLGMEGDYRGLREKLVK